MNIQNDPVPFIALHVENIQDHRVHLYYRIYSFLIEATSTQNSNLHLNPQEINELRLSILTSKQYFLKALYKAPKKFEYVLNAGK